MKVRLRLHALVRAALLEAGRDTCSQPVSYGR
jgi:hypothetical protein